MVSSMASDEGADVTGTAMVPLPALLSVALVAFTIEADNVAEQQLPPKPGSTA